MRNVKTRKNQRQIPLTLQTMNNEPLKNINVNKK